MSEVQHTVREGLLSSLARAASFNRDDAVAPVAILWTDEKRQWESILPLLQAQDPRFLMLGPYDPAKRQGPAIWIRCALAGKVPGIEWLEGMIPVVYLPGVSRGALRVLEDCPPELHALAAHQYRSPFWCHVNGKDWTVTAFLQSGDAGAPLDLAQDEATRAAAVDSLPVLLDRPIGELTGRRLDAGWFRSLLLGESPRRVLSWMNDPKGTRSTWSGTTWTAFHEECKATYGFDPDVDGELVAAEKLGQRKGEWGGIWRQFLETASKYPGISALMRRVQPSKDLFFFRDAWPQENEAAEASLRSALVQAGTLSAGDARLRIEDLERDHGPRRGWVWAHIGLSPLAKALGPLHVLSTLTKGIVPGTTISAMADSWYSDGWRVDLAALEAVGAVQTTADVDAVKAAVTALYGRWLEDLATRFQQAVLAEPAIHASLRNTPALGPDTCVLFVDALRLDLGHRLQSRLVEGGTQVAMQWVLTPFPSVTATAKPAVSPVAEALHGTGDAPSFVPAIREGAQPLTTDRFRKLLATAGIAWLASTEKGAGTGLAWTEIGELDRHGHDEQWKLVRRVGELLDLVQDRIRELLDAGWREVRVVTDHGWLLLPNGLPKQTLPGSLAESRWGRCALLKEGVESGYPSVPWHWNPDVRVIVPSGSGCFIGGTAYAHGGISLQECVVPYLTVKSPASGRRAVNLVEVRWVGLRCRVRVEGDADGCRVDLRLRPADPGSSLAAGGRAVGEGGQVALVAADPDGEGGAAVVVVLDKDGVVLAKQPTMVGGDGMVREG